MQSDRKIMDVTLLFFCHEPCRHPLKGSIEKSNHEQTHHDKCSHHSKGNALTKCRRYDHRGALMIIPHPGDNSNFNSMDPVKHPYDKDLIKRKILEIKTGIEEMIKTVCFEKFFVDWYGAYDIDPKHLVYWICVHSDKMKNKLMRDAELNAAFEIFIGET